LLSKGALPGKKVPPFFDSWTSKMTDLCMYTPEQQKKYSSAHLVAGCWYLDGYRNYTPESEVEERLVLDGGSPPAPVPDEDEPEILPPPDRKKRGRKTEKDSTEPSVLETPGPQKVVPTTTKATARRNSAIDMVVAPSHTESTVQAPVSVEPTQMSLPEKSISNLVQATEDLTRKRKADQFPSASSSVAEPPPPVHVFVSNTSIHALVETIEDGSTPDPRWAELHDFIAKVRMYPRLCVPYELEHSFYLFITFF
jgi:hypothetical protein